jgi:hypothetical protein
MPSLRASAALIGVDLGPNLSITGSLATILWLAALRREGQEVGAWRSLRRGSVVMFPARKTGREGQRHCGGEMTEATSWMHSAVA